MVFFIKLLLSLTYESVKLFSKCFIYCSTYLDKGEKKNMVATQFEAVDARRCFPCWDEPALKVITIDIFLSLIEE